MKNIKYFILTAIVVISCLFIPVEVKAAESTGERKITFSTDANTEYNVGSDFIAEEISGDYKYVYTIKVDFINRASSACGTLTGIQVYKKSGSTWKEYLGKVDSLVIPHTYTNKNGYFKDLEDDNVYSQTKNGYIFIDDICFSSGGLKNDYQYLYVPYNINTLTNAMFKNCTGHIDTVVLTNESYCDDWTFEDGIYDHISSYATKQTTLELILQNMNDGYLTIDGLADFLEFLEDYPSHYQRLLALQNDPHRVPMPGEDNIASSNVTITDNEVSEKYSDIEEYTFEEFFKNEEDGQYSFYGVNTKGYALALDMEESNQNLHITKISLYQFDADKLSFNMTRDITGNIGDFPIPSTFSYKGKTYTVTSLGDVEFSFKGTINSLTFPNTLTTVGNYNSLATIKTLNISNSVKTMGTGYIRRATNVNIDSNHPYLRYYKKALYNKDYTVLYDVKEQTVTTYTVKSTVKIVKENALNGLKFRQGITFPKSLTKLETQTFFATCSEMYIKFNGTTPPDFSEFLDTFGYNRFIITPKSAITAYKKAAINKNKLDIFKDSECITSAYYSNVATLNKLKASGDLTAKPADVSASDWKYLTNLSTKITKGCTTDYEKVKAISTWVSKNVSFDKTYWYTKHNSYYSEANTVANIKSKQADAIGLNTITSCLIKASGIPCEIVYDKNSSATSLRVAVFVNDKTWVTISPLDSNGLNLRLDANFYLNVMHTSIDFNIGIRN